MSAADEVDYPASPRRATALESSTGALPRGVMIGWGLGTLGPLIVLSASNALLLRFMTDYVGLSAAIAATLIGLSKLYDAFADPTMGWISDHTTSKAGRRRPYLLGGGFLLALSMVAIFWAPALQSDFARTFYMGAALIFYATAYTVFTIPYLAMPAEMTNSFAERTELMSYRVLAVGLAQLIAMFMGAALVDLLGGGASGHARMALVLAPIVMVSAIVCFVMTRSAPFTSRSHVESSFGEQAKSVLANRPFLVLISVKLLTLTSLSAQAAFPFFFERILGVSNIYLGAYFAVMSIGLMTSQPLWIRISRKRGKAFTFKLVLLLSVPAWLSWLIAGPADPVAFVFVRGAIIGLLSGGVVLMGQSLLPDTMEYDYLRTGLRREGIFAGFYTTVEKVAAAAGITLVGAMLSSAGYLQSRGTAVVQPESALTAIRLIVACLPAALSLAGFAMLFAYKLPESTLTALRAERGAARG